MFILIQLSIANLKSLQIPPKPVLAPCVVHMSLVDNHCLMFLFVLFHFHTVLFTEYDKSVGPSLIALALNSFLLKRITEKCGTKAKLKALKQQKLAQS